MIRWWRTSSVALLGVACSTPSAETKAPSAPSSAEDAARRAPGVAVDLRAELPAVADTAATDDGLVVLASPPDPTRARDTVRRFFSAVSHEAADEIDRLVGTDAWVETGAQRQPVRGFWRARFAQLDYDELSREVVYRDAELETFRPDDLARMGGSRPAFVETRQGDLIVRAKIRVSWKGRTRLFGDELVFLLRPEGDRFLIAEIAEDFRLP
jgi:hypothetical protein